MPIVVLACLAGAPSALAAAPGRPTLVAPSASATLSAGGPQLFTIRAFDADGDPYTGWVTVLDATTLQEVAAFATAPARSGQTSTGAPTAPLPKGSYTWSASASDVLGNRGPQSFPRSFSVGGSPDAGGGVFTGTVVYSPAPPPAGGPCGSTSFSVEAASAAAVLSFAPTQYAGSVSFSGSGTSTCETTTSGTGTLTLSAQGLGVAASTIACPQLTGQYTRIAGHLRSIVSGPCTINDTTTDLASFAIEAAINDSALDGAFTLSPAS